MFLSQLKEENLNEELINKIIYDIPEDDGLNGKCIFVFGSEKWLEERVKLAAELYDKKRSPYVLFSGGKNNEAEKMKEYAISLGIPKEVILTENKSTNTTENVVYSLPILEKILQKNDRLIVVSSPYHIRRIMLTLSKYMPENINYSYCYDNSSILSKDNWTNLPETIERVKKEASSIILYSKKGYIDDVNIELSHIR